jgi:uncharacterized protein
VDKIFVAEDDLLEDGFRLGVRVYQSGFRPTFIVGLWRGGSSVGIAVQECLQYLGVQTDHISIRTSYRGMSSYGEMVERAADIRVHGTQYLLENLNATDSLLIVDDVYSTGLNIQAVLERLQHRTKRNMPKQVRVAVPWFKPTHNRTRRVPDYFLNETDSWLVLPYEMNGLSITEIAERKAFLKPILDDIAASRQAPAAEHTNYGDDC